MANNKATLKYTLMYLRGHATVSCILEKFGKTLTEKIINLYLEFMFRGRT